MDHMAEVSNRQRYTDAPGVDLIQVMRGALGPRSHRALYRWLQDEVGELIPHQILIAVWGDFAARMLSLDVVSPLPEVRTKTVCPGAWQPFFSGLFAAWEAGGHGPLACPVEETAYPAGQPDAMAAAVARLSQALVHGIHDERGRHHCLYIFLTADPLADQALANLGLLLPGIDAAFRQIALLPGQRLGVPLRPGSQGQPAWRPRPEAQLSRREKEIMGWVSHGKTNAEIGLLLNISPITVRNHLQRIFRKLDVLNRAQAVFEWQQEGAGRAGS